MSHQQFLGVIQGHFTRNVWSRIPEYNLALKYKRGATFGKVTELLLKLPRVFKFARSQETANKQALNE